MATGTIEQLNQEHRAAEEANRDLGVIDYRTSEPLSDAVYEVTDGFKHLPGGLRLGPGQRFRPTARQVETNALRGKARELTPSQMRSLRPGRKVFAGADFGEMERKAATANGKASGAAPSDDPWGSLPMADETRAFAQEAGLTPADFEGIVPEGARKNYTKTQVRAMIEARQEGGGTGGEDHDGDDGSGD